MNKQTRPAKVMFVCHGNICRSPMAEFVMKALVSKAGLSECLEIASCATSNEEIGNDVYLPARRCLDKHEIPYGHRRAVRLKTADYDEWDLFVCMDARNMRDIGHIFLRDPEAKVHRLGEYAAGSKVADIADPWYTDDFERAYADILAGCTGLLEHIAP